ncbi:hypothetical protein DR62_06270 [Burkholderia thailandensis]|uniref:Uncharacterized protein n=1 Tax=Burkholderia thailandensis TaxID=57975 RepID=A0AAW9CXT1_BURTH|nr:hypothetical protein DR62_06270 [Burkholderia thailandensis]AOI52933.1 hypothetical protein WI24_14720 [Burkholderia thailandensis]MDW9238244.1 hypothetical protein [Burkholderia thailandensis]MDW9254461.1 hypothetical protein [Burkholderia thailandensis]PJO72059.1 hypothetical protein CWD92_12720 [Burkholderia thailandensis]
MESAARRGESRGARRYFRVARQPATGNRQSARGREVTTGNGARRLRHCRAVRALSGIGWL